MTGHTSWSEIKRRRIQEGKSMYPEWADLSAPANGIGLICKECRNLIDWHPVDHEVSCSFVGETIAVSKEFLHAVLEAFADTDPFFRGSVLMHLYGLLREDIEEDDGI